MPSNSVAIKTALLQQATDYETSKSLLALLEAVQNAFPSDNDAEIKRWCDLISKEIKAVDPLVNKQFLRVMDIDNDNQPDVDQAA